MSACSNKRACAIWFSSEVVKTWLRAKITQKPTVQPIMKFSQLIFWGETRQLRNFKKKSVRQILSYFLNRQKNTFSYFAKNLSYRFLIYFAWMFYLIQFLISEFLRHGHTPVCGQILRKTSLKLLGVLLVPGLLLSTRISILAVYWHLCSSNVAYIGCKMQQTVINES